MEPVRCQSVVDLNAVACYNESMSRTEFPIDRRRFLQSAGAAALAAFLSSCGLSTDEPLPSPSPSRLVRPALSSRTPTPSPTPAPGDCPTPGLTPWTNPPGDIDCDGYSSADEGTITTDPNDDCADDPTDDAWPSDFDMNTFINLGDVFNVLPPYFGSSPGLPDTNGDTIPDWSVRRDLQPNGFINLGDVFMVLPPYFGWNCTP